MLANAALKNPAQNPATVNIHDGQLVIPAAFSPHPNVFDVKAQIFHGASGFYAAMFSPLLLPWTFIRLPHSRWLSFIKPIYFPGVDQIFHIPEFLSHLPIPVHAIIHRKNGPHLIDYKAIFHQATTAQLSCAYWP